MAFAPATSRTPSAGCRSQLDGYGSERAAAAERTVLPTINNYCRTRDVESVTVLRSDLLPLWVPSAPKQVAQLSSSCVCSTIQYMGAPSPFARWQDAVEASEFWHVDDSHAKLSQRIWNDYLIAANEFLNIYIYIYIWSKAEICLVYAKDEVSGSNHVTRAIYSLYFGLYIYRIKAERTAYYRKLAV